MPLTDADERARKLDLARKRLNRFRTAKLSKPTSPIPDPQPIAPNHDDAIEGNVSLSASPSILPQAPPGPPFASSRPKIAPTMDMKMSQNSDSNMNDVDDDREKLVMLLQAAEATIAELRENAETSERNLTYAIERAKKLELRIGHLEKDKLELMGEMELLKADIEKRIEKERSTELERRDAEQKETMEKIIEVERKRFERELENEREKIKNEYLVYAETTIREAVARKDQELHAEIEKIRNEANKKLADDSLNASQGSHQNNQAFDVDTSAKAISTIANHNGGVGAIPAATRDSAPSLLVSAQSSNAELTNQCAIRAQTHDDTLRQLRDLQEEHAVLRSELERLRLSQADVGTLLLRTASTPSSRETIEVLQRRCDELAAYVHASQTECERYKREVDQWKRAALDAERSEKKVAEMEGELRSVREAIDREKELWKGREEVLKGEAGQFKDEVERLTVLFESIWNLAKQCRKGTANVPTMAPLTDIPLHESTRQWEGHLESMIRGLVDEIDNLNNSIREAHVIIDLQHEKIEALLDRSDNVAPVSGILPVSGSPHRRFAQVNAVETQTDHMFAFMRLETIKGRLAEAGVIWRFDRSSSVGEESSTNRGDPCLDNREELQNLKHRLSLLANLYAQLQTAHANAQSRITGLGESLGHMKRLVVSLSAGGGEECGPEEDETVWASRYVEKEKEVAALREELDKWRTRCQEVEEIMEQWGLGGGFNACTDRGIDDLIRIEL